MDKLAELARIVGAQVAIDQCGHCGQTAELESVNDSGNGTATIELRCHGESSRYQVKATGTERIRLVPFEKPLGQSAKDRLGGITTGPFRGGITR